MEKEVQQLLEMGATVTQARAALRQYRDVMEAAEKIFEGQFDDIIDDETPAVNGTAAPEIPKATRMVTPDEEQDAELDDDDEGSGDEFLDYDSDYDEKVDASRGVPDVDPYAGIFFSKDRREEVIEVEEDPEIIKLAGVNINIKTMTQGQWMKGCPEGGEQSFLFSLYDQLSSGECPCPECKQPYRRKKSDFFALYPEFSQYIDHLRNIVRIRCSKCSSCFCLACNEPISADKTRRPNAATDDNPLFHCSNLQGVILGVGLSMLEQLHTEQSQDVQKDLSLPTDRTNKKRKVPDIAISEDMDEDEDPYYSTLAGRGKKAKGGTGYAGVAKEDTTGQAEALAVQRIKDEKMAMLLSAIRVYLPSCQRKGGGQTSDYLVHPTTLAHLRRRFNFVSSSLLRNDSLTDMSDRAVLYFELFEWLETISNHEALASMMAMPIMVPVSFKYITSKKAVGSTRGSSTRGVRERTVIYEGSSGPRELMEAIVIQSQAALKGLEGARLAHTTVEEMTEEQKRMTTDDKGKGKEKEPVQSPENLKLSQFCQRILSTAKAIDRSLRETKGDAFVERLHASISSTSSTSNEIVSAGNTEEETRKAYLRWATGARFQYCDLSLPVPSFVNIKSPDDQTPNYKFYYNTEARLLANADIPKRSLAIAKELAVLTTNLPVAWDSSVFLRVDETRVDIIKCLITGPEGTPYYNGCYLFDIFLGPSYNQTPPSVKYMTTAGGKYRFNPNLYADGKVCLSLLGTWAGPGWISGKSTLLQVLISIQSMILCEEPYLNEPGWANSAGTPQSIAYSANIRRMVVNTAMLGMLKNPPEPFGDVIRTHFRLKSRSIRDQLDCWLGQDDGKPTSSDGGGYSPSPKKDLEANQSGSLSPFAKDIAELKTLLEDLERGGLKDSESMDVDS
ncbi:ubiquitin conjugating enzyme family protein [Hysterangium stoloniferum]|nr:ubiquitin conjugating enzyme family protein [Hysterangium stoloniferum]